MRTIAPLLALLAGCAPPDAAFVGSYTGTQTCAGRNVDTGELVSLGPDPHTVVIDQDAETGQAFIAGRCTLDLDVRSDDVASFEVTVCNVATADGTPLTVTYESGSARLTGDDLTLDYSVLGVSPTETLTLNYVFHGSR
jgi:hypothetical protein